MNVETRITKLGDLLGKELHSLRRVAEDYGLVDLELKENTTAVNPGEINV